MTIHVHHLTGCSPTPLAHYLKGLGILRLVAEQKDRNARGWWRDEAFHLATVLDEESLKRFFLEEYRPTPIIAPWNGGSGFYPKDNKDGITAVCGSTAERFAPFRRAIELGRTVTAGLGESPKGTEKSAFLRRCRREWRGPILDWLEAAIVLDGTGDPAYPALLGTGGNDGRLDFTNNYMQHVAGLFDLADGNAAARPGAARLLGIALYSQPEMGLKRGAVGQFLPGSAGGANSTVGFAGDAVLNSWDFVLMLEGACLFAASVARRMHATALPQAAAPFAVRSSAVGYGSAAEGEKDRGEQWFPLWDRPATLDELRNLIAEGRSQIGRHSAGRPVDFGRAVARLGVARGITAFQRYGYIERNGQANLAVPLGRWPVRAQPHQDLIDEVAHWVESLRRAASGDQGPASIARAARVCEEAILACCRDGANARRWQELLIALGRAEAQLPRSPRFTAEKRLQPLPHLGRDWLRAADDGSAELRLALAFASQHGFVVLDGGEFKVDWSNPIRRHFLPLAVDGKRHRFLVQGDSLASPAEVVCVAGEFEAVALALLRRRLVEAGQENLGKLPLLGVGGAEASLDDISRFLAGDVDERKILDLARPLMALDWTALGRPLDRPAKQPEIPGLYGLVRIAYWPRRIRPSLNAEPVSIPLDPVILNRLMTGDLVRASATAIRRLSAAGLRPHLRIAAGDPALARRIAASLVFPIAERDAFALAHRLARPELKEESVSGELAAIHPSTGEETP
ncbi:MAG TPA: type I-U CRISPR-associated protein Csx17 [Longimicrobiales bacterium]|nr:type I-U CRISPR-associated protein Csx17 [Longimicrobiales bacterium]